MSNINDFVIENGTLKEYKGTGGDVVIPEGVVDIGDIFDEVKYYGFDPPHPLTSVVIPKSMTEISSGAFMYSQTLKKVVLHDALTKIGSYAFSECAKLSELKIPDSVTEIGAHAFSGCKKLNITLPPNLKSIEEAAFRDCAITSIVIPQGVNKVGKDAFLRCNKIKTAGPAGGGYDYEFPWTEEIPDNAFAGLRKLTKVILPATIKKVGNNAFKDCKELTDLTMPSYAKISKTAFKGCEKLGEIKEHQQAETISADAEKPVTLNNNDFSIVNGCLTLYKGHDAEVIIPDGVKIIGRRAFYFNKEITSVVIPASVEEIAQEAFEYCHNLNKVIFNGQVKKAGTHAFGWISDRPELEIQIYNAIAIRVFSKSAQGDVIKAFCRRFADLDKNTEIFRDNINFIGTHLKMSLDTSKTLVLSQVMENEAVLHAIMEAAAIPANDTEWMLTQLNPEKDGIIVAEILNYKNKLLEDPKKKKALEKSKAKAAEKELSAEMTATDWRKIFKFSYSDGDVVIKETKISGECVTVPSHIGAKKVRIIDRRAFTYAGDNKSPEKIIISEGIIEIKRGAFYCLDDSEVFIPNTVTALPVGTFIAVSNLTLHLPASLTEIPEELEWDSADPAFKAIYAPTGSFAETYAKEHNIPFIAE
ncbi:MAG: leucine-rich repeat domain-containing protein [Clostridia bacterium]|nr:leucine-rich repeat domain-containing protein [Clostridia bacterium]